MAAFAAMTVGSGGYGSAGATTRKSKSFLPLPAESFFFSKKEALAC
jgi:hypothetical protein